MLPKTYLILNYKEAKYWVRFSTVTQQEPYENVEIFGLQHPKHTYIATLTTPNGGHIHISICNLEEAWLD